MSHCITLKITCRIAGYFELAVNFVLFVLTMATIVPCFYEVWKFHSGGSSIEILDRQTLSVPTDNWYNVVLYLLGIVASDQLITGLIPGLPTIQTKLRVTFWRNTKFFTLVIRVTTFGLSFLFLQPFPVNLTLTIFLDLIFIAVVSVFLVDIKAQLNIEEEHIIV